MRVAFRCVKNVTCNFQNFPADEDFQSLNEVVVLRSDVTRPEVSVRGCASLTIIDDDISEQEESFQVLINGNDSSSTQRSIQIMPFQASVLIRDNDGKFCHSAV